MTLLASLLLVPLVAMSGPAIPAPMPEPLVGAWTVAAASGDQYCDTSDCTSAYGGSETWTFGADSHWEYSQYLSSALYACVQTTFLDATGTVTATADTLTLITTHASDLRSDTCGESTYEELDLVPMVYRWVIATAADGHPQLYLTDDSGTTGPLDLRPLPPTG
jgi:hypothetical protein